MKNEELIVVTILVGSCSNNQLSTFVFKTCFKNSVIWVAFMVKID